MDTLVPRRWQPLVIASLVAGLILLILGNTGIDEGEEGGIGPLIATAVAMLVATFLLWRYVVSPRAETGTTSATAALALGVLAILTGIVYWTGLAFAFAPAAIGLGSLVQGDEKGRIAMVLGWIGLLIAILFGVLDQT